jgi:hypothetical protein
MELEASKGISQVIPFLFLNNFLEASFFETKGVFTVFRAQKAREWRAWLMLISAKIQGCSNNCMVSK